MCNICSLDTKRNDFDNTWLDILTAVDPTEAPSGGSQDRPPPDIPDMFGAGAGVRHGEKPPHYSASPAMHHTSVPSGNAHIDRRSSDSFEVDTEKWDTNKIKREGQL